MFGNQDTNDMQQTSTSVAADLISSRDQYLCFSLGDQEYCVDIQRVQEIKGWDRITRVPYTEPHILGVINLRGAIVPVIDLRLRFGLPAIPPEGAVIVVVTVPGERGHRTVGILVDAVADVYDVPANQVLAAPEMLGTIESILVNGMTERNGTLLLLIDIELLIASSINHSEGMAA
jgi:purine-binding chemotaxis protein CheW